MRSRSLAAEAGMCPVTYASGKSRGVVFRWACNHRLRKAIVCFADNSRHSSPWAAAKYRAARSAGQGAPRHALVERQKPLLNRNERIAEPHAARNRPVEPVE